MYFKYLKTKRYLGGVYSLLKIAQHEIHGKWWGGLQTTVKLGNVTQFTRITFIHKCSNIKLGFQSQVVMVSIKDTDIPVLTILISVVAIWKHCLM